MGTRETFPEVHHRRKRWLLATAAASLVVAGLVAFGVQQHLETGQLKPAVSSKVNTPSTPGPSPEISKAPARTETYPLHHNITATMFWVGEPPDTDNKGITNVSSAWVDDWVKEFGGVDNPDNRCGYQPCGFTPKENAFYFALPFNDYGSDGNLKPPAILKQIPWYNGPPPQGQSLVKNRWIAVMFQGKTVYGQWEDVGPFGEDDEAYVFGTAMPKVRAGLDLSPAMNDYLRLDGEGAVSWQFVNTASVPAGPWKQTITSSGLNY